MTSSLVPQMPTARDVFLDRQLRAQGIDPARPVVYALPSAAARPRCGKCGSRSVSAEWETGTTARLREWHWSCLACGWESQRYHVPHQVVAR